MPRYFIQLAYNGANYNGWQEQDNTPHTVQQVLREKLSLILGEAIEVTGCGRTDTGVHAKDYYAHFDTTKPAVHLPDSNVLYKLNKVLPHDIAIKRIRQAKPEANARFDALWRSYGYYIHRHKDPFLTDRSLYVFGELDIDRMNQAAAHLLTVSDFTSFSKVNTQTFTNNCTVTEARWEKLNENEYVFCITANRFLRNMVRAIVGTLLETGKGKQSMEQFKKICESKNRSEAGMSAPGHALYLTHIHYPETIFNV